MNAKQAKALTMHHSAAIISTERAKVDSSIESAASNGKTRALIFSRLSDATISALREDGYHVEYQSDPDSGKSYISGHYVISWA